jgi:hypothetical protein
MFPKFAFVVDIPESLIISPELVVGTRATSDFEFLEQVLSSYGVLNRERIG